MADTPGSNDSKNLQGLTKQTYAKGVAKLVPGTGGERFQKIKKALKWINR